MARTKCILALMIALMVGQARAALVLDNLSNPTYQTLIDTGNSGVIVGDLRFYDFTYLGAGSAPPTASQISVRSNGNGIDFLGAWGALDGDFTSGLFTWKVTSATSGSINELSLFSDGLTQVAATGTYVSLVQTLRTTGGAVIGSPIINYNDGISIPNDTTQPDQNLDDQLISPQGVVSLTTALQVKSGAGGLATLTYFTASAGVSSTTVTVPEASTAMAGVGVVAAIWLSGRKRNWIGWEHN